MQAKNRKTAKQASSTIDTKCLALSYANNMNQNPQEAKYTAITSERSSTLCTKAINTTNPAVDHNLNMHSIWPKKNLI